MIITAIIIKIITNITAENMLLVFVGFNKGNKCFLFYISFSWQKILTQCNLKDIDAV